MKDDPAISVLNLSKCYQIFNRPQDRLKQSLFACFNKKYGRDFWALHPVSFKVNKGQVLGIIGRNGSGKSTLLQIIAGTLTATTGEMIINGRTAALLELGSGFNPEYSGRENVFMNGSILGFARAEMEERFDEIAAFADIGEFIDQPVKFYSSGMFVRLAFAVQACVEPDVLIVDEALSVGDVFFQQKCHARMEKLLKCGTAIVMVSHDMTAIEKYCDQALVLDNGNCLFLGQTNEAIERYYQTRGAYKPLEKEYKSSAIYTESSTDHMKFATHIVDWPGEESFLDFSRAVIIGEQDVAECTKIAVCNEKGEPCTNFEIGETGRFYFEFKLLQDIQVPVGGIVITNRMDINVHGKNSLQYLLEAPPVVRKGARLRFRQTINLSIAEGEYTFMVGLATISIQDYNRVTEMDYAWLESRLKSILRIRQAGRITMHMRSKGQSLPFHGYADLDGNCAISILS